MAVQKPDDDDDKNARGFAQHPRPRCCRCARVAHDGRPSVIKRNYLTRGRHKARDHFLTKLHPTTGAHIVTQFFFSPQQYENEKRAHVRRSYVHVII